jgi:hypothetical protein
MFAEKIVTACPDNHAEPINALVKNAELVDLKACGAYSSTIVLQ